MDSVLTGMRAMALGMAGMARNDGWWMTWNLALAVVPAVLAIVLFRRGSRRTLIWWVGVVVFVIFLPNAPYVLTDVVHLFEQIRATHSNLQVLGVVLPVYVIFFAGGFGCYLLALRKVRDYLRSDAPEVAWPPVLLGLHALCALGIYLGRVVRLNSWAVVSRPWSVLWSLTAVDGFAIALIVVTFAGLLVLSATSTLLVDAGLEHIHSHLPSRRRRPGR